MAEKINVFEEYFSQAWWYTPVIPVLRRLKQKDHEFKEQPGLHSKIPSQKTECFKAPVVICFCLKSSSGPWHLHSTLLWIGF
jgi:hypothetical protein